MFYERYAYQKFSGSSGITTVVSDHEGMLHGIAFTAVGGGGLLKLFDASGAVGSSFAELNVPANTFYTMLFNTQLLYALTIQNVNFPGTYTVLYK